MKEPLRAKLGRVAKRRGISLNAEIVDRLESSFVSRDDVFGGYEGYALMRFLATGVELVEHRMGKKWWEDVETKNAVRGALDSVFESFGPQPDEGTEGLVETAGGYLIGTTIMDAFIKNFKEATAKKSGRKPTKKAET